MPINMAQAVHDHPPLVDLLGNAVASWIVSAAFLALVAMA